MIDITKIRKGVQVYGADNQLFGTVERVSGNDVYIGGKKYTANTFNRFEQDRLYMDQQNVTATSADLSGGEIKVPVVEEQLNVGKRQVELGEVQVNKTVSQEKVNVPVELRREEVQVREVDIPDRPVQPGEATFQEGTIRVPLRGEEAVVSKQAVVTGEVDIKKDLVSDRQQVSDTVRKERVSIDKNYPQTRNRAATEADSVANEGFRQATVPTERVANNEAVTVQDEAGAVAANTTATNQGVTSFSQAQIEEGSEVVSADGERIGKVKEVTADYFLIGRGLFKADIEANYNSIQDISDDRVVLNLSKAQIDALT